MRRFFIDVFVIQFTMNVLFLWRLPDVKVRQVL